MEVGEHPSDLAVHLLGEGPPLVVGAQSSLHVTHLDARVEGGQAGRCPRCGVTLHQRPVGPLLLQDGLQSCQDCGGHLGWGLVFLHDAEVVVGHHRKNLTISTICPSPRAPANDRCKLEHSTPLNPCRPHKSALTSSLWTISLLPAPLHSQRI